MLLKFQLTLMFDIWNEPILLVQLSYNSESDIWMVRQMRIG